MLQCNKFAVAEDRCTTMQLFYCHQFFQQTSTPVIQLPRNRAKVCATDSSGADFQDFPRHANSNLIKIPAAGRIEKEQLLTPRRRHHLPGGKS